MDGQFQARIELPDGSDAWDDWFSWQEEGVDWRRKADGTKGKKREAEVASEALADVALPEAVSPPAAAAGTFASAPPPPAEWAWPYEGECIEVEVEAGDEAPASWVPSRVLQVLVDGLVRVRVKVRVRVSNPNPDANPNANP